MTNLSKLIESELEKAELVLAAKAISEKLQKIAEDLAKVEAQDLMPMMDQLKMGFGEQIATNFSQTTSNQLRQLLQNISTAKSEIDNQVIRMEGILNGNPDNGSDMAADVGVPTDGIAAPDASQDGSEASSAEGESDGPFAPEPGENASEGHGEAHHEAPPPPMPPEGRLKKESFAYLDRVIVESFKKMMEKKVPVARAANYIAEKHGVDLSEVVSIIKEAKVNEAKKANFKIGDVVHTTMGVFRTGKVIRPISRNDWSDGTYKEPSVKDNAVYVEWSDGTKGWSHPVHLAHGTERQKIGESSDSVHAAKAFGLGNTTFGLLNVGDVFKFKGNDGKNTKISTTSYKDANGKTFKTGSGSAVIINEMRNVVEAKTIRGTTNLTRKEALKKDNGFYIDKRAEEFDDDNWYVFGNQTGFAYGSFSSKAQARILFDQLTASKKSK